MQAVRAASLCRTGGVAARLLFVMLRVCADDAESDSGLQLQAGSGRICSCSSSSIVRTCERRLLCMHVLGVTQVVAVRLCTCVFSAGPVEWRRRQSSRAAGCTFLEAAQRCTCGDERAQAPPAGDDTPARARPRAGQKVHARSDSTDTELHKKGESEEQLLHVYPSKSNMNRDGRCSLSRAKSRAWHQSWPADRGVM